MASLLFACLFLCILLTFHTGELFVSPKVTIRSEKCNRTITFPYKNVHLPPRSDWEDGNLQFYCLPYISCDARSLVLLDYSKLSSAADIEEAREFTLKVAHLDNGHPIGFSVKDTDAAPELFAPLSPLAAMLKITHCATPRTTGKLPNLNLPNLMVIALGNCASEVAIKKADFSKNCMLRVIQFLGIYLLSIEPGTFTDLPELRHLGLERQEWRAPSTYCGERALQALTVKLHCDCEYRWMRKWFKENPRLLAAAESGELYNIGEYKSRAYTKDEKFSPIDCANISSYECGAPSSLKNYSLNDPCKDSVDRFQ